MILFIYVCKQLSNLIYHDYQEQMLSLSILYVNFIIIFTLKTVQYF